MSTLLAISHLAFRATTRSHPLRALASLLLLASLVAPALVAFTFGGGDALAVSGAFGSAALLAPVAALFGGVLLASGDSAGEGLRPILRGPAPSAATLAASVTGIAVAAIAASVVCAIAAAASLRISGRTFPVAACAGAMAAAAASAPAAAAAGLLLATAAPRALASAAAILLGAGVVAGGGLLPAGTGAPTISVVLLARDAAFGELPARAVALSCAASLLVTAALLAATTALCRAKDLAPRPGDA